MESWPRRANSRISSRCSQGFFSRLRRSTRCAFVSFRSVIRGPFLFLLTKLPSKDKKPTGQNSGLWASKLNLQEKLDSSAPLARDGRLTTTAAAANGTATPCLARVIHVYKRLRRVDSTVNHPCPSKI